MDPMDLDSDDYRHSDFDDLFISGGLSSRADDTQPSRPQESQAEAVIGPPSQLDPVEEIPVLQEFTLFPKLPTELRLKIWKAAQPGPRVVEVEYDTLLRFQTTSTTLLPSLLRVSRESCTETLKAFKRLLRESDEGRPNQPIYFDPRVDTLFLSQGSQYVDLILLIDSIGQQIRVETECLALDLSFWEENVNSVEDLSILCDFKNLQIATVVLAAGLKRHCKISLDKLLGLAYYASRDIRLWSLVATTWNGLVRKCGTRPDWKIPTIEIRASLRHITSS